MTTYYVSSGVTSSGFAVTVNRDLEVLSGGTAEATVVAGTEVVSAGGFSDGDFIHSQGVQKVYGTASGARVEGHAGAHYGVQDVFSGGRAIGTVIQTGTLLVRDGGMAAATIVSGGFVTINEGGVWDAPVLEADGGDVEVAGLVSGAIVKNADQIDLDSGGYAFDSFLRSGAGLLDLGHTHGGRISGGAAESVVSGGVSVDDFVLSGALEFSLFGGGTISGLTVSSGGTFEFQKTTSASGLDLHPGAMLLLYNVKSATAVLSGNELEFSSASVVVETVTLASASDTLSFSASVNSSGTEFLVEKAAPDAIHAAAAPDVTSTIIVSSGVTSSGLYVDHLDTLEVLSGGKVIDTTVRGFETISAGGLATGDVVDASIIGASSGLQFVLGVASSTVVHAGGYQVVSSGGRADGSRVGSGGFEFITAGGHASGGVIRSGGYEFVATTGVVTGVHIRDYGDLELSDAGAYGDGVGGGGVTVGAVDDDGRINVRSNGVASSSIVNSGGLVSVTASGEIVGTYLRSGGVIQVASGESVSARVSAGALEIVFYGESLSDYVYSGGTAAVVDSATISALVVSSGGLFDWFNRAASVSDLRLHPGAEISVSATSAVAIISGGVLEVMSQGGAVIFDTATLEGGGSGLTLTSGVYSSGYTEFTVEKATPDAAARPALLAQAIAAMPANNPLSPMVFHDGTVSAAVHVIGTTS